MPPKDEFDKIAEQERQLSAKRGRDITTLQLMDEWASIADLFFRLTEHWKRNILKFTNADSIDKIAMERIYWSARIAALEDFFREMQNDMEQAKKFEEEENAKEKRLDGDKNKTAFKDRNPYRSGVNNG